MAKQPISVLLTAEIDEFVRELPNRAEWLRQAIADAHKREMEKSTTSASDSY